MFRPRKQLAQRKEIKRDKFTETLIVGWRSAKQYGQKILLGVGAVVIIVVGVKLYQNSAQTAMIKGRTELGKADYYAQTGKEEDAVMAYQAVMDTYSGFIAGQAHINLANLYFQKGEFDAAEKLFTRCAKKYSDAMLRPAALHGQAACQENRKEFEHAATTYKIVVQKYKGSFLATECLMAAARCYRQLERWEDAEKCYQSVVDGYPESEYAREAQTFLKMVSKS